MIRPSQGFRWKPVTVTVRGQGFRKGAQLSLVNNNHQITLKNITIQDPTELHGEVPAQSPAGVYDLQLTLGEDKPVTLGGAFEIIADNLTIYCLNVGQGNATLVISPAGQTLLIDTGAAEQGKKVMAFLRQLGLERIDHLLLTHYHADHIGGVAAVLAGPDGKKGTLDDQPPRLGWWDRGGSGGKTYDRLRATATTRYKGLDGSSAQSFPTIDLGGGAKVQVQVTNGVIKKKDGTFQTVSCGRDENCRSIGTLITFGQFRYWAGGDLTGGGQGTADVETPLAAGIGAVDVYQAHHHGSKTSSNKTWVQTLRPQVVLISAGPQNKYCHPHQEPLSNFARLTSLWMLVTSAAIKDKSKCSTTTRELIRPLGERALLEAGTIHISVETDTRFTVYAPQAHWSRSWKTQGS